MEVKERKVELIELFYDLIYVYAIANMTLLIEEPEDGIITWGMLGHYILLSMVIIQAWLFMTNYVNHYSKWRWFEYAALVVNMSAAVLMAQTIKASWTDYTLALIVSMIIMIGSVAALYAIQYRRGEGDNSYAKNILSVLVGILLNYIVAFILHILGYVEASVDIVIFSILLGMFLPFLKEGKYDLKVYCFPHMVERLELLTIITFGECIVGITVFFDVYNLDLRSVLSFVTVITMFGTYVCQVHYMCNHHQIIGANRMIWAHYLLIMSINVVTVAFLYLYRNDAEPIYIAVLMTAALAAFHMSLFTTKFYYHDRFSRGPRDAAAVLAFIILGGTIMIASGGSDNGILFGALVTVGGNFAYILSKYLAVERA